MASRKKVEGKERCGVGGREGGAGGRELSTREGYAVATYVKGGEAGRESEDGRVGLGVGRHQRADTCEYYQMPTPAPVVARIGTSGTMKKEDWGAGEAGTGRDGEHGTSD